MFTTDLVNLYNRNIFKTSVYIYIFQDEKCRLMRNLSLSMTLNLWRGRSLNEHCIIKYELNYPELHQIKKYNKEIYICNVFYLD